ncbi:hypothetical protein ANACAC_02572 [Anaerostipes caccae L1-92]|uniref:Uncharacterized protein n=1 Tax=Anaerostipes caccae (strain DSM 14662 / CCUG 47493 / JCM 13470 / NCIMB 13811 / L1-92) TaxID=411490 RepID=B0MG62_ANACD|nr:hypothetical protein ANACAC_02572 [Anaerostipes caccae L1-92]
MWKLWITWISKWNPQKDKPHFKNLDVEKIKKNPQEKLYTIVYNPVDNVDNYFLTNSLPIESTFPAPIVINKSFFLHFF